MLVLLTLPVGCFLGWLDGLRRIAAGKPLLPWRRRDNVPWGLLDLAVIVVLVGVVSGIGVTWARSLMGIEPTAEFDELLPGDRARVFLAFGTATLMSTGLSFLWLWLRYERLEGLSSIHFGKDVELGFRWFMMLVVPVVLMQLVLTRWIPTRHPLIEMLKASKDVSFLPVAAYAAVIAAPLFEESFFRLFLQGWLEKLQTTMQRVKLGIGSRADSDAVLVGGESASSLLTHESDIGPFTDTEAAVDSGDDSSNPYRASVHAAAKESSATANAGAATGAEATDSADAESSDERPILWIPILVTSSLFALAHLGHGPDWIPLFFLAMGLGYLYQRTGRILPCIVVHMLVNGLGVIQLWAAIRQP